MSGGFRAGTPQLRAGKMGAFDERVELRPGDGRMDRHAAGESPEPAVDPGDHPFPPNHARIAHNAIAYQFRMLDQHSRMGDDTGDQKLMVWQVDMAPYLPFMFVARVGAFE